MSTTADQSETGPSERLLIRISPSRGWVSLRLGEVWAYRELLFFFVWRDIKVRYKQTVLGGAWAIIQPFFTMVVFTIFFGRLAGIDKKIPGDIPYPLFTFAALVPWVLFAGAMTHAGNSLVREQRLVSKIYFPRLVLPISSVLSGLVDFAVAFAMLLVLMVWFQVAPGWGIVVLPALVLLAILTALTVGLWISALNVHFRDFRYTVPFLVQFWLLATPVAYPTSLIKDAALKRLYYGLNPMAGVVDGFRWALLGMPAPDLLAFSISCGAVIVLLIGGLFYFRRLEKTFADVV